MPELVCAADDPRWLDERRKGVTATDIAAIIGISPYESAYGLYWKKLGHISDTVEDTPRLRLGRDLEPLIALRWAEEHPGAGLTYTTPTLYRSGQRSWQMATTDAMSDDGPVEMKSWADADRDRWNDGNVPATVRAQVLWQMDTLDVATGHVGVLFLPSGEFRSYVIEHDESPVREYPHDIPGPLAPSICQACGDIELMRTAGEEFMARLRLELPPPSPDASSATLAALKARFADPRKDKQAEVDPVVVNAWRQAKEHQAEWTEAVTAWEVELREQGGDAGILTVAGVPVARHTVTPVKGHWRKAGTRDSITRIKNGETDV